MLVTWTTFDKAESRVEYGLLGGRLFEMSTKGESTLFVDSGVEKRKMFIHRVTLTGLRPAATYGEWPPSNYCFSEISLCQHVFLPCDGSVPLWEWRGLEWRVRVHCLERQLQVQSQVCSVWRPGQREPSVPGSTAEGNAAGHVWRHPAHRYVLTSEKLEKFWQCRDFRWIANETGTLAVTVMKAEGILLTLRPKEWSNKNLSAL